MTEPSYYQFKKDQKRRYLPQSHNYPITTLTSISGTHVQSNYMYTVWVLPSPFPHKVWLPYPSSFVLVGSYFDQVRDKTFHSD